VIAFPDGVVPSPKALRLVCRGARPSLKVPFGLTWSTDETADVAVVLQRASVGGEAGEPMVSEIREQLPRPESLANGTLVLVLADLGSQNPILRILAPKARVGRAARATALLAAGYTELGGGVDRKTGHDLVWGTARRR
jgi:hypothetical protein